MKSQANMAASMETNKAPATDPKGKETHELLDTEVKIIVLRKLGEL